MQNKRSQVEDSFGLIIGVVFLVLLVAGTSFASIHSKKTARESVSSEIVITNSGQHLLNFLRNPVVFKGYNTNVAGAIDMYYNGDDKQIINLIESEAYSYFSESSIETDYSSWSIELSYAGKETIIESERSRTQMVLRKQLSIIKLPSASNENIDPKLFLITTGFVAK
jgi:hypothetical protein